MRIARATYVDPDLMDRKFLIRQKGLCRSDIGKHVVLDIGRRFNRHYYTHVGAVPLFCIGCRFDNY